MEYGDVDIIDGSGEGLFSDASYSMPNFIALLILAFLILIVYMVLFTDAPGADSARNFLGIKKRGHTS